MKLFNFKNKKVFIVILTLYALLVGSLTIPIKSYEMILPGNISPITKEIEIEGLKSNNEFYSIYVFSYNKPTLFQLLVGSLTDKVEVSKNTRQTSSSEDFYRGALLEELSFQYSIINAYLKALETDNTITIDYNLNSYVISYSINDKLKVGDRFTFINGVDVKTLNESELKTYFKDNDELTLTIINDQETKDIIINKKDGLFGIIYDKFYEIKNTTPAYKAFYKEDNKVGPSGGLLQTLEIYSLLTGKKFNKIISGTGTIEFDGSVGAIGSVKQKIYTANNKVDIFFCPEENYEEALKVYKSIKNPTFELVKVGSFDEALEKLLE